jgi:hypothetical protein
MPLWRGEGTAPGSILCGLPAMARWRSSKQRSRRRDVAPTPTGDASVGGPGASTPPPGPAVSAAPMPPWPRPVSALPSALTPDSERALMREGASPAGAGARRRPRDRIADRQRGPSAQSPATARWTCWSTARQTASFATTGRRQPACVPETPGASEPDAAALSPDGNGCWSCRREATFRRPERHFPAGRPTPVAARRGHGGRAHPQHDRAADTAGNASSPRARRWRARRINALP